MAFAIIGTHIINHDINEMQCITEDIHCLLSTEQMSSDFNDAKDAVLHMKAHTSDGISRLQAYQPTKQSLHQCQ